MCCLQIGHEKKIARLGYNSEGTLLNGCADWFLFECGCVRDHILRVLLAPTEIDVNVTNANYFYTNIAGMYMLFPVYDDGPYPYEEPIGDWYFSSPLYSE